MDGSEIAVKKAFMWGQRSLEGTSLPKFPIKSGNLIIPTVKLTSVVVTCLVLSLFWRPYCCTNRTVGSSCRHLVDFVANVRNANHPHKCSKNAKVRPRCIHLCSFSLRVCPTSSNIDKCVTLECPRCRNFPKHHETHFGPLNKLLTRRADCIT